ncbi:MAG: hypothetical protein HYR85_02535 [Planctomycetes bacterium]|nr:hypothetical protein [Planctomycetota bacterium]MBI3847676.1 hypothetical protein [Planctomycetota bacterium]
MHHFRCTWARVFSLALLFAVAGVSPALAQNCPQPDGLDPGPPPVNCCAPAQLNLPQFPAVSQGMKYICFDSCNATLQPNLCVDIGAPQPVQQGGAIICGIYLIRYQIKTCNPANPIVLWTGTMRAHYSRTWGAAAGAAPDTQVWRFLLNGDLVPSQALLAHANNTCVVAPCRAAFNNRIHVWGYIDYALDCNNGRFQAAWGLNHGCDYSEHSPGSARPGAFHPTRSYTWLGPTAGFVINSSTLQPSVGALTQDSVRLNRWAAAPAICVVREPAQGSIDPTLPFCPCSGPIAGPAQYLQSFFRGQGVCNTNWQPLPNAPIPFMQKRIGSWTNPAVFPGTQELLFDEGFLQWVDGCMPGLVSTQYVKGVETIGGFPAFKITTPPTPLGRQFEDLGTANRGPNNPAPIFGANYVSWYILNLNAQ